MKLGIIGATGWLGAALGTRLLQGGWPEADLLALNRTGRRDAYARWPGVQWMPDAATLCRTAGAIVLSVRPEDFPVAGYAGSAHLVVSFMAGWSLGRLTELHPGGRVVRAMPNGAAVDGKSFTPWVAAQDLSAKDTALVRRLLSVMGDEAQVETEDQLDYLSALSGSGAAYPALMAQAMLDHAALQGLPQDVARQAVASVLASGGAMAADVAGVDAMLQAYHGYRGITAAGLGAAEKAGFSRAVAQALDAARNHARAMTRDGAGPKAKTGTMNEQGFS